jgi:hypothetical protein
MLLTLSRGPGAPPNALGIRRIAFAVDDIDSTVAGLQASGVELLGSVERYEDAYRLCYVRGPEGIIVMLAEQDRLKPPAGAIAAGVIEPSRTESQRRFRFIADGESDHGLPLRLAEDPKQKCGQVRPVRSDGSSWRFPYKARREERRCYSSPARRAVPG